MRAAFLAATLLLSGCESMQYYAQAIGGQLSIMRAARPVDDLALPTRRRRRISAARLEHARGIREFASRELALPRQRQLRIATPSSAGRTWSWNVFAAPEFSTEAEAGMLSRSPVA